MGTPANFKKWAEERGISPFHPDQWSSADHDAYYAMKLENFKALMVLYKLMPRLMPRDHLKSRIREALERLKEPPPSTPWRRCPCHTFSPVRAKPEAEMPHGILYLDSFRRRG